MTSLRLRWPIERPTRSQRTFWSGLWPKGAPVLRDVAAALHEQAWIRTIVGGYGSGKTTAAAGAVLLNALRNPWTPAYGGDNPTTIVVGLTMTVINDSSRKALANLIDRRLIKKEWKGERKIRLINGHDIIFRTAKGKIEGLNAAGLWLDEAHQLDPELWANYQMRVRDVFAEHRLIVVSGLPETGWLQDTFDQPIHREDPERMLVHASTYDNHALDRRIFHQLRSSMGAGDADSLLRGLWQSARDAVFYSYDEAIHLTDYPGKKSEVTHLTIDVGNRGAALLFQKCKKRFRDDDGTEYMGEALHFVDEYLPENMTTEQACRHVKNRGWKIVPKESMVFLDPRSNPDQIQAVYRVFGQVQVIRKTRGQAGYDVDEGHRAVNAALLDANNQVKLTFYRGLPREKRSLLTSIPKVRRKPDGDGMVKDNITDHVADALRMPVVHLLPLRLGGIAVKRAV